MIYHIEITNGCVSYAIDYSRSEPNAKRYFGARGLPKPKKTKAIGWPWACMYVTHGTEENGCAVAWKAK